jgi:hypothetical protein
MGEGRRAVATPLARLVWWSDSRVNNSYLDQHVHSHDAAYRPLSGGGKDVRQMPAYPMVVLHRTLYHGDG